jgi:hypothetical protein
MSGTPEKVTSARFLARFTDAAVTIFSIRMKS